MSRPVQAETGWPASCLTLPIGRYIEMADSNPLANVPVSADAQNRIDAAGLTHHIRNTVSKIQATADKWGKQ